MGSEPVRSMYHERPYWRAAGSGGAGIAWSYPEPFPEVARLAGYVAFDQDEVRVIMGKGAFTGVRP